MKNFLKDNIILVAGITLPLLLALVFFMATRISVMNVTPPQTSVIFTTGYYPNTPEAGYNFDVQDSKLIFRYTRPQYEYAPQKPRLFIYEPVKGTSREIELPTLDTKKTSSVPIQEVGKKIDTKEKSPDSFIFESGYSSGNSNLMTEIFGGGSHYRNQCVLRKDGYRHVVPEARDYNCHFIGWIVE